MAQLEPSEIQHQQMQSPAPRKQIPLIAIESGTGSGALVGSELPVNQCPGCREGQLPTISKSVADRSRKVITSSILHSPDCISITAPSSDLQQEKHQQS